jgi:hypothetical protein
LEISSQINVFDGINSSTNGRKFIKIASKTVENYINFWWNKGELFLPFGSLSEGRKKQFSGLILQTGYS